MTADNYQDILNRVRSEMVEPVTIPSGTWKFEAIAGTYTTETTDDEILASGGVSFKPIEPTADVDDELFDAYAKDSMASERIWHNFWIRDVRDQNDMFEIFEAMGMPDLDVKDSCAQVKGYEVLAYVYQKPRKADPTIIDTKLKQFAPVEE